MNFEQLAQDVIQANQWRVGVRFYDGTIFKISTIELAQDWGIGFIRINAREVTKRFQRNGNKLEFILHADQEFDEVTNTWTRLNARQLKTLFKGKSHENTYAPNI